MIYYCALVEGIELYSAMNEYVEVPPRSIDARMQPFLHRSIGDIRYVLECFDFFLSYDKCI